MKTYFHMPKWLFVLTLIVLILRIPTFFEPYSYGDEMIYLALGEGVRKGVPLYSDIHDNKPPLLYLTAALAGNLFWFKAILLIWHLVTIFIFWRFVASLFPKKESVWKISTLIFSFLTTLPFLEGNIANAEIFMIGPTILAFYLIYAKSNNVKSIFGAGVLISLSSMYKIPAVFDVFAILFFWLTQIKLNKRDLLDLVKKVCVLFIGILIPIGISFLWYFLAGSFKQYLVAAYLQNFGYLSSWRPTDVKEPFLTRNGPLLTRGFFVFFALGILYGFKNKLSKQFILITSWVLMSFFAVTLSERPYPHYLIQSLPPLSILLGMLYVFESIEQVLTILPITFLLIAPVKYNFWYYSSSPYYVKFIKFVSGSMDKNTYLASFGGNVLVNYEVSDFITKSTYPSDKVFVWGDSSTIYALSRRLPPGKYVADYHISDFSSDQEVYESLLKQPPEYIFIDTNKNVFKSFYLFLTNSYIQLESIGHFQVWSKITTDTINKLNSPDNYFK